MNEHLACKRALLKFFTIKNFFLSFQKPEISKTRKTAKFFYTWLFDSELDFLAASTSISPINKKYSIFNTNIFVIAANAANDEKSRFSVTLSLSIMNSSLGLFACI